MMLENKYFRDCGYYKNRIMDKYNKTNIEQTTNIFKTMEELNITIGKTYNYFDDGKIKESRKSPVVITHIIPFGKICKRILKQWVREVEECDWLYKKKTDYFINGDLYVTDAQIEKIVFVRASRNGWFSLGWWAGRLDTDGSLTKISDDYLKEYEESL